MEHNPPPITRRRRIITIDLDDLAEVHRMHTILKALLARPRRVEEIANVTIPPAPVVPPPVLPESLPAEEAAEEVTSLRPDHRPRKTDRRGPRTPNGLIYSDDPDYLTRLEGALFDLLPGPPVTFTYRDFLNDEVDKMVGCRASTISPTLSTLYLKGYLKRVSGDRRGIYMRTDKQPKGRMIG